MAISVFIKDVKTTGFTLEALSTRDMYAWHFQINGSDWKAIVPASPNASRKCFQIVTTLTPDTTYSVRVRGRTNMPGTTATYEYSSNVSVTTLPRVVLQLVNDVQIDRPNPSITFKAQFNDGLVSEWDLGLWLTSDTHIDFSFNGVSSGTYTVPVQLPTASMILSNYMSDKTQLTKNFEIQERGMVGDPTNTQRFVQGKIITNPAYSSPIFNAVSYEDINSLTTALTGDNQKMIEGESRLQITCQSATAQNGASIVKYYATVEEKTVESSSVNINYGAIDLSGEINLTIGAIDSRGYKTTITKTLSVLAYSPISFDEYSIKRVNSVEATINAIFNGSYSSIEINGVEKNSLKSIQYGVQTSEGLPPTPTYIDIQGVTSSDGAFSYNGTLTQLNVDSAWIVSIVAKDELTTAQITIQIPKAIPLMSFRDGKVGIETNNPTRTLDVMGDVGMNNRNALGFIRVLEATENLNDITEQGIYDIDGHNSNLNYPDSYEYGSLIVIEHHGNRTPLTIYKEHVLQIYISYALATIIPSGDATRVFLRKQIKPSNDNPIWTGWCELNVSAV